MSDRLNSNFEKGKERANFQIINVQTWPGISENITLCKNLCKSDNPSIGIVHTRHTDGLRDISKITSNA